MLIFIQGVHVSQRAEARQLLGLQRVPPRAILHSLVATKQVLIFFVFAVFLCQFCRTFSTLLLFFLSLPSGHDFFLVWQAWPFSEKATIAATGENSVLVTAKLMEYHILNTRFAAIPCDQDIGPVDLTNCLINALYRHLKDNDAVTCVPIHLKQFMPHLSGGRPCANASQVEAVMKEATIISTHLQDSKECIRPCLNSAFVAQQSNLVYLPGKFFPDQFEKGGKLESPLAGDIWYKSGANLVFLYFPESLSVIKEQIPIYDQEAIVASVGGGLGLFLGFSCLRLLLELTEKTTERLLQKWQ